MSAENTIKGLKTGGIYPALKTSYENEFFINSNNEYFSNNPIYKEVSDYIIDAKAIYPSQYFSYNFNAYKTAQENILFNKANIEAELEAAKIKMINNKNG